MATPTGRMTSLALVLLAAPLGAAATAAASAPKGTEVSLDGLTSRAPAEWKELPTTSPMRLKQFALPKVGADAADAEVTIFYFGQGQGGNADQNITRWKTLFTPPAGKTIDQATKVQTFKVGSVPVTYVDISGTYLFKARPMDPASAAEPRPGYRMLAVVFESPKGPYFLRLVGPEKTVAHYKSGFDGWVKAFK